jgi:RNA polymerase sigma factor (sigma-70 family)
VTVGATPGHGAAEDLLRFQAPLVLGALVRRYGHFDACEDAVQEALLAAAVQWPEQGVPENPRGWLITVASRRLTDQLRSEEARRRREEAAAALVPRDEYFAPAAEDETTETHPAQQDDTLTLLFLCCHPALTAPSQIALTLRAVGGLTTAQIASAFLVPEATMAQRISRAKQRIKASDGGLRPPRPPQPTEPTQPTQPPQPKERAERIGAVLHVLYLIFNEGYTATSGEALRRGELTGEALRLAREVHRLLPGDGETAGLLALMLLTDARSRARTGPDGGLVPLAEQDRTRWDRALIDEGTRLIEHTLTESPLGPYQLQAAIAALHAGAARAEETDWRQIAELYRLLESFAPGPMVTLNRAVALGMAQGPKAGLDLLATLDGDERIAGHHRLDAVRAHLLEMAGDAEAARGSYVLAARRTTSTPERRYLEARAARLA